MTDAELEELDTLLEDLRLWFNAAPLHLCPTRDALIRGDMDKFYARVEAKCGTIRSLREENAELKDELATVSDRLEQANQAIEEQS
ncbi:MAG: hypothetical protein CMH91_07730 [Oceanicaulis sp.]|uniref:hypothetical protein n=1 Tax=unclassified Oceanicaulis TaxID=2632123 RepID=UPI000C62427C|nr:MULTISPECIES: hypothetical protein [unclassified Oceanicaulis]MBC38936.1 hypothetical protein [Oceanicaulis sp.]MBG37311.1 hypothetical protein [Oceanicaulis sp.]HBU61574.1 hypothetical protein [Oceanicaulis sp.]|tara:strand:- start:1024 stop:1281 length:258 start_codon:yes stop_codon:yes gene_type:complete